MDTAEKIIDDILAAMAGAYVAPSSATEAVDYLTYRAYRHNREMGLSAADLAKLWPQTGAAMESKFQDEINAYAAEKVSADKAARHQGVTEHDLDVVGRALRAGT